MKIFPLEFSSFESLFKDKKLVIPYYQRDYIWSKDNWEKWLKDIKKLIDCEDIEEIHFIGSIIYKKTPETNLSSPEYLIIDGQQRITTFFVFCFAIFEILKRNSSKNAFLIESIEQILFLPDKHGPRLTMRGEDEKSLGAILSHKNPENNEERERELEKLINILKRH